MLKDKDLLWESDLFEELNQEESENINGGTTVIIPDVDFFGGDFRIIRNTTLSNCRTQVNTTLGARFGTFVIPSRTCFVKGLGVNSRRFFNAVGIINI